MAAERERLLRDGLQALTGPAVIATLAAAFAHAGNNRLTALAGGLDLLEAAAPANDDSRAALGLAMDATQALANDMSALLAGARWSLEPSARVGVRAAARRASSLQSVLATDAVPVALDVPAALTVSADPGRFAFALLLLSLDRRFRAAGVEVAATELGFDAPAGRPNAVRPGRYCRLEVRFDGAGRRGDSAAPRGRHGLNCGGWGPGVGSRERRRWLYADRTRCNHHRTARSGPKERR